MSLRIAHVTATFPPYHGGTGNVCLHNARELARRGHEVTVLTAAVDGAPAYELREGFTVRRLRPLLRLGNAPVLPGLLGALHSFDLVHLHYPFILGAEQVALAASMARTPLVVTCHNDLIGDGTWRDLVFRLATWSSRQIVLNRANQVLFVSQGHAETCDQRVVYNRRGMHCAIMSNGVDVAAFHPGGEPALHRASLGLSIHAPLIGFVGSLDRAHHYKGLHILLEALRQQPLSHAQAIIIGDGELKSQYIAQTRQTELSERVHFFGAADHETLPRLYRACDVVAVPSLVAESFGLVVVEALACGVPVVASQGPGVCGLIEPGPYGLLVPPGDEAALAAAIGELLADEPRRRAMGARGREKMVACYAWPAIGKRLEQLYYEVLEHHQPSVKPAVGDRL